MAQQPLIYARYAACARHATRALRALRTLRTLRMLHALRAGSMAVCAAMAFGCSTYPVDTTGRDMLELESVWQYLKAYCIGQDSVPLPPNAFTCSTPESLLASVNDTLHGHSYTGYTDTLPGGASALSATDTADSGQPVYYAAISPLTAYVRIVAQFSRDTTLESFLVALPFLSGFSNILLDLRWNGGGDIAAMDSIIEYFLPVNTPYIVATYRAYDRNSRSASTIRNERWTTKHGRSPSLAEKNIIILMNRGSASASEILAAGIKDGRASSGLSPCLLVGDTSYGKGIGQVLINRSWLSKRDLSITYLRVVRACGCADSAYHRKGLAPDIAVTNSDAALADTMQFLAAFHVLEPGVSPSVIIFNTLKKTLSKKADCVLQPIPELEK